MNYIPWETRSSPSLLKFKDVTRPKILDWGIHISRELKIVYIDNPKVASGSIKMCLESLINPNASLNKFNPHNRESLSLLSPAYLSDEELEEALFSNEYYRFCFVRNPYTRLLSAYLDKFNLEKLRVYVSRFDELKDRDKKTVETLIKHRINCNTSNNIPSIWENEITFDNFVSWVDKTDWYECDMHWRLQSHNTLFNYLNFSYIGKFENLDIDLENIISAIAPQTKKKLPIDGGRGYSTKADEKLEKYYTDQLRERVYQIYEEDFLNFGY